jgi:hypothetical protein
MKHRTINNNVNNPRISGIMHNCGINHPWDDGINASGGATVSPSVCCAGISHQAA